MRRVKPLDRDHARQDRWLISYVDIITILLVLFVAVAAQGLQHAQQAVRPVAPPPASRTPPPAVPPTAPVARTPPVPSPLEEAERQLRREGIELKMEQRGLIISLPQAVLFGPGQSGVAPTALSKISLIAGVLRSLPNRVVLVGHADASPVRGTRFGNWELSSARSLELLELLSARYGVPETRLSIASHGSQSPSSPNDTADGRAANRRVEIVILSETGPVEPQPDSM